MAQVFWDHSSPRRQRQFASRWFRTLAAPEHGGPARSGCSVSVIPTSADFVTSQIYRCRRQRWSERPLVPGETAYSKGVLRIFVFSVLTGPLPHQLAGRPLQRLDAGKMRPRPASDAKPAAGAACLSCPASYAASNNKLAFSPPQRSRCSFAVPHRGEPSSQHTQPVAAGDVRQVLPLRSSARDGGQPGRMVFHAGGNVGVTPSTG